MREKWTQKTSKDDEYSISREFKKTFKTFERRVSEIPDADKEAVSLLAVIAGFLGMCYFSISVTSTEKSDFTSSEREKIDKVEKKAAKSKESMDRFSKFYDSLDSEQKNDLKLIVDDVLSEAGKKNFRAYGVKR